MSTKWNFKKDYSFKDKNFSRIYRFYVIETPVSGTSYRGKTFKERKCNMKKLNSLMKKETIFLKENWHVLAIKEIEKFCKEIGLLDVVKYDSEIVIHSKNDKLCTGNTDSLYYAIRCSFAHGSFDIRKYNSEKYYILENKDGGKIKARLILKETTLLKWIDLVEQSK